MTADELIKALELEPHPEGGCFRETYRASGTVDVRGGRSPATVIYFALRSGEVSQWHKVASDELWLFQGGDPLTLNIVSDDGTKTWMLGLDLASGAQPQILVPANVWQSAAAPTDGAHGWTLVACVVSPGFDYADFTVASEAEMRRRFPESPPAPNSGGVGSHSPRIGG